MVTCFDDILKKQNAVVSESSKCHGTAILGTAGRREDTDVFCFVFCLFLFLFFSFTVVLNKD